MRRLVPALGIIALASPAAMSQEIAKGLFLEGYSDNIFKYTAAAPTELTAADGVGKTTKEKEAGYNDSASFATAAVLHVGWKLNDQVAAKLNLQFNSTGPTADAAYLRESFVALTPGNGVSVNFGKFISHIGWQAAESTGLYRVNAAPKTGDIYGSDSAVGTSVGWSNEQVSVAFLVANGFLGTEGSGLDNTDVGAKTNPGHTLGYGADFTYNLPNKLGNVNLEWAYDPNPTFSTTGGANQFGLNTTLKPTDKLLVAGEVIYRTAAGAVNDKKGKPDSKNDIFAFFIANHVLPTDEALFPSSASVSFSRYAPGYDTVQSTNTTTAASNEVALAWLTNPLNTTGFGLNFEVAQTTFDGEGPASTTDDAIRFAVEGLVVIP